MVELPFWDGCVYSFGYSYDEEDDVIVVIPLDEEGNVISEEKCLAVAASVLGLFLDYIRKDYKNIMDIRRGIRRGKEKGVDPEVVHGRFRGQVLAEDIDSYLRGLSSDKASVSDSL